MSTSHKRSLDLTRFYCQMCKCYSIFQLFHVPDFRGYPFYNIKNNNNKQSYCLWSQRTVCKELCEEYLVVAGHVVIDDGGERLIHH